MVGCKESELVISDVKIVYLLLVILIRLGFESLCDGFIDLMFLPISIVSILPDPTLQDESELLVLLS